MKMRVIIAGMNTTKEVVASACTKGQVQPFHTKRVFHLTFQILAHLGEIPLTQWRSLRKIEHLFRI